MQINKHLNYIHLLVKRNQQWYPKLMT